MDAATAVIDVWIALTIIAVIVAIVRAWQARMPRLGPLPAEARNSYTAAWNQVARRFVDAPQQAVREADVVVSSLLRDRGHPLAYEPLPRQMVDARRDRVKGEDTGQTEALRKSFIKYRAVFEKMIGETPHEPATRRRELA